MKINIKTTGVKLTPALEQYLSHKLSKIKNQIDESAGEAIAGVEIGKTTEHHRRGELFKAELTLDIPGQALSRSVSVEYDLYTAIDAMKAEILSQIKTKKGKEITLFRKGARQMKNILRGWR